MTYDQWKTIDPREYEREEEEQHSELELVYGQLFIARDHIAKLETIIRKIREALGEVA